MKPALLAIALAGLGMIWTRGEARVAPALFVLAAIVTVFAMLLGGKTP